MSCSYKAEMKIFNTFRNLHQSTETGQNFNYFKNDFRNKILILLINYYFL